MRSDQSAAFPRNASQGAARASRLGFGRGLTYDSKGIVMAKNRFERVNEVQPDGITSAVDG
jgi:hypothetical protein